MKKNGITQKSISIISVLAGSASLFYFLFSFYLNLPIALFVTSLFFLLNMGFLFAIVMLRLAKANFKRLFARSSLSFLTLCPLVSIFLKDRIAYNSNIWFGFLFVITMSCFVFLQASLIDWNRARRRYPAKGFILPFLILCSFSGFFVLYFTLLSIIRHKLLLSTTDLGGFSQVFWNTLSGKILHSTWYGQNFLAEHFSPILLLITPIYWLWQAPECLLFLNVLFLGTASILIYYISFHKLKDRPISLIFALCYLLHPFLSRVALTDFYEASLSPLILLSLFLSLIKNRTKPYFLLLFLALFIKEEMALLLGGFGLLALRYNKKAGIATITIAIIWGFLCFKLFMPYIAEETHLFGEKSYKHIQRYQHLGGSLSEVAKNLMAHPVTVAKTLLVLQKIVTLIMLFLPICFLSLLSPLHLLPTLPILLLHLLAYFEIQHCLFWHYSASILPFLLLAGIYGFSKLKLPKTPLAFSILTASLLCSILFGRFAFLKAPFPEDPKLYHPDFRRTPLSTPLLSLTEREKERIYLFSLLKELIPDNASVSCGETWATHLSKRAYFYPFIEAVAYWREADYVLLNLSKRTAAFDLLLRYLDRFEKEGNFCKVFEEGQDGFVIYVRKEKRAEFLESAKRLAEEKSNSHTHFILSSLYHNLNMPKRAKEETERVLKISPDYYNPYIYTILGESSLALKDAETAFFAYRKAAEADPTRVIEFEKVKALYLEKGLSEKAETVKREIGEKIEELKERAEKEPDNIYLKKQLAFILANRGEYREALFYLREILKRKPGDSWAKRLYFELKDFD
jgi:uncharacterized membrane protein